MARKFGQSNYTWEEVTISLDKAVSIRDIDVAGDYVRIDEASDPEAHVFVRMNDPLGPRRKMRLSAEIDGAPFEKLYIDFPAQPRDAGASAWVKLLIATTYGTVRFGSPDPLEIDLTGIVAVEQGLITADGTRRRDERFWVDLWLQPVPGFTPQEFLYGDVIQSFDHTGLTGADNTQGVRWDGRDRFVVRSDSSGFTDYKWYEFDREWVFLREVDAPRTGNSDELAFDFVDQARVLYLAPFLDQIMLASRYSSSAGTVVYSGTISGEDDILVVDDLVFFIGVVDGVRSLWYENLEQVLAGAVTWKKVRSAAWPFDSGSRGYLAWDGELMHLVGVEGATVTLYALDVSAGEVVRSVVTAAGTAKRITYRAGSLYRWTDDAAEEVWPGDDNVNIPLAGRALPARCASSARILEQGETARTTAAVNAIDLGGGRYSIQGELIGAALAWYAGDWNAVADDYMDHVYAIQIGEGIGEGTKVVSRAQTLAAAEVDDDFGAILPAVVHLQIDRGAFAGPVTIAE